MKYLVTGGAGFIGSNIANTLVNEGNDVICLDDMSLGVRSNLDKKVRLVEGSVMDFNLVMQVTNDVDYIFHDAAKSSSPMFKPDPRLGVDVNLMGFMNVMEAAKTNNVKKVVYASSSSIYSGLPMPFNENQIIRPKTFYEISFYCREIAAYSYYLEKGLKSIGLRYFSVYGPNERHKKQFANNATQILWDISAGESPVIYGDGNQTRDFTFVKDIVQANILAAKSEKEFGIYNAGTGISTTFNKVIELVNKNLGTNVKAKYINNPVSNYVQDTKSDISLISKELGYKPTWSLEEGIKSLIQVYVNPAIVK